MARRRKAKLADARTLTPSVRGLSFRMTDGSAVGHTAGQYVDLIVPTLLGLPFRRSYSIASAPDPEQPDLFEVAVTRVEGGPTSAALHALDLGAVVEVEGPEGHFVWRPEDRANPALLVATGTGLAPIHAMLQEETRSPGPPLVLLFGCRTPGDLLWEDELRAWERSCSRFRLHVTLSRPPPDWLGLAGYVQVHAREIAESMPGLRAYVCGVSAMVDEIVAILARDAKLPRDAIRYEVYD